MCMCDFIPFVKQALHASGSVGTERGAKITDTSPVHKVRNGLQSMHFYFYVSVHTSS